MEFNTVLLVVTIAAVTVAAVALVFPALKKKGVNTGHVLKVASTGLSGADQITDVLKEIFPANGIVNIVDKIVDYAKVGVQKAEQLYKINQIDKDARKEEATRFVNEALELAGVEITPAIQKIVDGSIEAAVNAMSHDYITLETGVLVEEKNTP